MASASMGDALQATKAMSSPVLGRATLINIKEKEISGVPLNTPWTFWVDKSVAQGSSAAQYEAGLRKLYTVKTVEGFWSVYNNIPQPSKLNVRYTYHLMRHERKPLWEEEAHQRGGHWRMKCEKSYSDTAWKEVLLAAIGETLSNHVGEGDEISGVSISVREPTDVIEVWHANSSLHEKASVTQKLVELLSEVRFSAIFYKAFDTHHAFEKH